MKRAFNARAVILRERTDAVDDVIEIFARDRRLTQIDRTAWETAFGLAPEVHNHFDKIFEVGLTVKRFTDMRRHDTQKQIQIVRDFPARQIDAPRSRSNLLT